MGRFVRKGEKGIAILAPIVGRRNSDAAEDDSKRVLGFRAAYVFDDADRWRTAPRGGRGVGRSRQQDRGVTVCRDQPESPRQSASVGASAAAKSAGVVGLSPSALFDNALGAVGLPLQNLTGNRRSDGLGVPEPTLVV